MDDKIKEVMGLVDEYLDSKIKNGSYTYNEKTHCARLAIETKLREMVKEPLALHQRDTIKVNAWKETRDGGYWDVDEIISATERAHNIGAKQ